MLILPFDFGSKDAVPVLKLKDKTIGTEIMYTVHKQYEGIQPKLILQNKLQNYDMYVAFANFICIKPFK